MAETVLTLTLTQEQVDALTGAVIDKHMETKRYVKSARDVVESHEEHGEQCCRAEGAKEHDRACLAALEARARIEKSLRAALEPHAYVHMREQS